MPVCSDCKFDVPKADYSPSQLKKKPDQRKCKACIVMMEPLTEGAIYKLSDDEFRRQTKKAGLTVFKIFDQLEDINELALYHRAART